MNADQLFRLVRTVSQIDVGLETLQAVCENNAHKRDDWEHVECIIDELQATMVDLRTSIADVVPEDLINRSFEELVLQDHSNRNFTSRSRLNEDLPVGCAPDADSLLEEWLRGSENLPANPEEESK